MVLFFLRKRIHLLDLDFTYENDNTPDWHYDGNFVDGGYALYQIVAAASIILSTFFAQHY